MSRVKTEEKIKCDKCGKNVNADNVVHLELDTRDNTYHEEKVPAKHSQGMFPFHPSCAKSKLSQGQRPGGRPRKGDGVRERVSGRIEEGHIAKIQEQFGTIQNFIDAAVKKLVKA